MRFPKISKGTNKDDIAQICLLYAIAKFLEITGEYPEAKSKDRHQIILYRYMQELKRKYPNHELFK